MNTLRLRAEHSAQKFYNRRQNEPLEALAGDGAGNVTPTAKHGTGWDYVRIGGDADDVHEAKNSSGHTFAEDDSVLIHWVKRTGLGFYEIIGYSGSAVYDNPSDTTQTTVLAHAAQHQRRDQGQGGFDPLDIYARMVVPLRARPQTSPNLTLHVEAGYNPLTGNYYAGGDSAAFSAPAGLAQAKIDLLYLGSDDALHIVAGTPVAGGSPALPAMVLPSVPLAFVYLSTGQTTITESNIYRDPGILRAPVGAGSGGAPDNAEYVVLALNGTLSQERVLTNGTGIGLTDGGAGGNVELKLADTAVTPATYGDATHVAQFTVDQQGRLTAASDVAISGLSAAPFSASADGAWCWFSDPRAVYYNDHTYIAYVKSNGDIAIRSYDHATHVTSAETVLHATLEVDDHDNPAILVRASDHKIIVFYSKHDGADKVIYERISSNPEDISAFAAETTIDPASGAALYSYVNPVQLTGEASSPIYLFYRRHDLAFANARLAYTKSTDGGVTWSAQTLVADVTYHKVAQNGNARIDFAVSNHPGDPVDHGIYHFYYQGGNYYQTDGTLISAGLPLAVGDLTQVYDGSTTAGWVWDVAIDRSTNYPVVVYATFPGGVVDHRYNYGQWSGASWVTNQIAAEGGGTIYAAPGAQDYYSGGVVLDHENPQIVYLSKIVGGQFEVYQYWTVDGGTNWQNIALTTGSASKQIRPVAVRNHANDLRVVWLSGTYTTYTNFALSILGYGSVGSDEKVKITGNDATTGYLKDKLAAGANITLTENDDGGTETLTIAATGGSPANPTAQVGPSAVNGSAATFMRSDAAPKLADTAVTPGTYGDATNVAQITVDQQGRITAASEVALSAIPTVIYSPLTNGDPVSPALVFDPANGDVILIAI